MNMNIDILLKLKDIHDSAGYADDFLCLLSNFKVGRTIILRDADGKIMNSSTVVPNELIQRLIQTVNDYINEQNQKLDQVQVSNLPFNAGELDDFQW